MADDPKQIQLFEVCGHCNGEGILSPVGSPEGPCGNCGATGRRLFGVAFLNDSYMDKMDALLTRTEDILDKCADILDALEG